jgi:hypothetical protein
MRRFAWASPRAIKRLTPRQIHYLFTTILPGEEKAAAEEVPSLNGSAYPPPPRRGSWAEYQGLVRLIMTLGSRRREDADAEWLAKRGPLPTPED